MTDPCERAGLESLADEAVVALAQSGDTDAEELIFLRYKNAVRIKARPYFLMGADREDLIQEGMIGLYHAIRDYEPGRETTFHSFAEMCILRQILSAVKRATRQKHRPLNSYVSIYRSGSDGDDDEDFVIDGLPSPPAEEPEQVVISRETSDGIMHILENELSPLEKRVLSLYLDGLSYEDISAAIGRGTKAVDNALQRIKRKVGAMLGEETY